MLTCSHAYLLVCFPAWGKFLWWACCFSCHLLPLFLPPPPPLVSPGCRSPRAPPPFLALPVGHGDEGPADWDSLPLPDQSSCHSSHWPAVVFDTASSCAQWKGGCRQEGRSFGTGRMSAGHDQHGGRVAGRGPNWVPMGGGAGQVGGWVGQACGGVRSQRTGCHLDAQPLLSRKKTEEKYLVI